MSRAITCLVVAAIGCGAAAQRPGAQSAREDEEGALSRWARGGPSPPAPVETSDTAELVTDPLDPLDSEALGYATLGQSLPGDDAYRLPSSALDVYSVIDVTESGVIEGTVTWRAAPAPAAHLAGGPDCPDAVDNPTLDRAADGSVAGALVYLDDIREGKAPSPAGGVIEDVGCRLVPHLQLAAPVGTLLVVANDDATPRALIVRNLANRVVVLDEVLSARRQTEVPLVATGIYEVAAPDNAATLGFVVVPRHPYYAVTDAHGHFRLDDVPPGAYTLAAWHEPPLGGRSLAHAAEARGLVRVTANATTLRNLDLK